MSPTQVVNHFGTVLNASRVLLVTTQTIYFWIKTGRIPRLRQYDIEEQTKGKLKRDRK